VNNTFGDGPTPAATLLAPVAGTTNVDPSRQVSFAFKLPVLAHVGPRD